MTQPMASASHPAPAPSSLAIDDRLWAERIKADVQSNYHYEMALAIAREGNGEAAASAFERAILANLGWSAPYVGLIGLLEQQGRMEESATVTQRARSAIAMFDQEAEAMTLQREITALHERNQLDEAQRLLEKAYALHKAWPLSPFLVDGLGDAFFAHAMALPWEELGKAVMFLSRTLEINPSSPVALEQFGIRLHTLGDFEAAKEAYGKAADLRPAALTFARLSNALVLTLQFPEAEQVALKGLQINAKEKEAILWLGISLALQSRLDEAEAVLESGIKVDPGQAILHAELGFVRMQQGQRDDVEKLFRKAISMQPHHSHLPAYLGLFWLRMGDIEKSINVLRRAIQIFPRSGVLHTNLGLSLQFCKRDAEALASHRRAMMLEPEMMPVWIARRAWAADRLVPIYRDLGLKIPPLMHPSDGMAR